MNSPSLTARPAAPEPSSAPNSALTPAPVSKDTDAPCVGILGTVDTLSESEQIELYTNEAVIATGWETFVQVGLALARIRQGRLYRGEFDTFEAYCQIKWQYGRRYVDQLISAAQISTHLRAVGSHLLPEHEKQVRPLAGLSPEQVQQAWQNAVEKAGKGKVTERLVKNAVKELQATGGSPPAKRSVRPNLSEQRRLISSTIGELLKLVSQKANSDLLTEKVELLDRYIQALFSSLEPRR